MYLLIVYLIRSSFRIHLFKELEEELEGGKFTEEKNFTCGKRKNWRENNTKVCKVCKVGERSRW